MKNAPRIQDQYASASSARLPRIIMAVAAGGAVIAAGAIVQHKITVRKYESQYESVMKDFSGSPNPSANINRNRGTK